jgi:hypothetical protein
VVVGSAIASLLASALVVLAAGQPQGWWQAWSAAAATLIVSVAGTLPALIHVFGRLNTARRTAQSSAEVGEAVQKAAPLVLGVGLVRMVLFAAGAILFILLLGTPKWPTFGFVAGLYFVLAAAEVSYVGVAFWKHDETAAPAPQRSPQAPAAEHPSPRAMQS